MKNFFFFFWRDSRVLGFVRRAAGFGPVPIRRDPAAALPMCSPCVCIFGVLALRSGERGGDRGDANWSPLRVVIPTDDLAEWFDSCVCISPHKAPDC